MWLVNYEDDIHTCKYRMYAKKINLVFQISVHLKIVVWNF